MKSKNKLNTGISKGIVVFLGMFAVGILTLPLLALSGCPLPANSPDATTVTATEDAMQPAAQICAKLLDAGCVEGQMPNCQSVFANTISQNMIRDFSVDCILEAGSKNAEQGCPGNSVSVMAATGNWVAQSSPFLLASGALYAADLDVTSSLEDRLLATKARIIQKFTDAGFTGVTCTDDLTRAEGTWGKASQVATLPSEVTTVWKWQV